MWRSRRRTAEVLLPPCSDGTQAHRFAVADVAPLPDGRVVEVVRKCGICGFEPPKPLPKWFTPDHNSFTTETSNVQVYGYLRPGQVLARWKPEG